MEKQITEEQKKKVHELHKKFIIKTSLIGLKYAGLNMLAALAISAINVLYVHSPAFTFVSSVVSVFMILHSFSESLKKEHDIIKVEVRKILDN